MNQISKAQAAIGSSTLATPRETFDGACAAARARLRSTIRPRRDNQNNSEGVPFHVANWHKTYFSMSIVTFVPPFLILHKLQKLHLFQTEGAGVGRCG